MAVDQTLLQIVKYKAEYQKVIGRVPRESMDKTTVMLLDDFGKYFDKFPEHSRVDLRTFASLFTSWHPKLAVEQKHAFATILKRVNQDVDDERKSVVMQTLLELRLAADMANLLVDFEAGELADLHGSLDAVQTAFKKDAELKGIDFVQPDLDDLLALEAEGEGIEFRLNCLNQSMRPLRDGDFGIVAGRPDKGKTTWLASELTHMASQTERSIVWLNNEGPGNRIYTRLYQAALGIPISEVVNKHRAGTLIPEYEAAIKGDRWKIKVFDIHGYDNHMVERIVEQHKPALVVYDMIDKVRGFPLAGRTDERLEAMYDWARDLGVKHNFAGMATSQISVDGADMQFPQDHMLKDSKTGKQGACDFIIMIGSVADDAYRAARFIGVPKNKLRREGADGDPQAVVSYKPQIARYEDVPELEEE